MTVKGNAQAKMRLETRQASAQRGQIDEHTPHLLDAVQINEHRGVALELVATCQGHGEGVLVAQEVLAALVARHLCVDSGRSSL